MRDRGGREEEVEEVEGLEEAGEMEEEVVEGEHEEEARTRPRRMMSSRRCCL